jgi:hypothetical protein
MELFWRVRHVASIHHWASVATASFLLVEIRVAEAKVIARNHKPVATTCYMMASTWSAVQILLRSTVVREFCLKELMHGKAFDCLK